MKNKNIILLVSIAFLLLSCTLHSQIKLGVQAGPNFANVSISDFTPSPISPGPENNTGLFVGMLAEIKMSDMFQVQDTLLSCDNSIKVIKSMANKYQKSSHFSDRKYREILKLFSTDISAAAISNILGISRPLVNRIFKNIRIKIAEYCEENSIGDF